MMPSRPTIRVVIADDHQLVRAAIGALLARIGGVEVIAEARDGEELLKALEPVQPDVVITDIAMPRMDGIAAIKRIRERYPELRVLVLTMDESVDVVKRAVASGANGFIRKSAPDFELETALRSVMSTGTYFGAGIAQRLLEPTGSPLERGLTERQIEVLSMLASGRSSKQVAFELGLSTKTVNVHRTRIMDRLQLRDLPSMTLYAVRHGLIKA